MIRSRQETIIRACRFRKNWTLSKEYYDIVIPTSLLDNSSSVCSRAYWGNNTDIFLFGAKTELPIWRKQKSDRSIIIGCDVMGSKSWNKHQTHFNRKAKIRHFGSMQSSRKPIQAVTVFNSAMNKLGAAFKSNLCLSTIRKLLRCTYAKYNSTVYSQNLGSFENLTHASIQI